MNFNWSVNSVSVKDLEPGFNNVVQIVMYRIVLEIENREDFTINVPYVFELNSENFQPYESLTESQVLEWRPQLFIDTVQGMLTIQASIDYPEDPVFSENLPW